MIIGFGSDWSLYVTNPSFTSAIYAVTKKGDTASSKNVQINKGYFGNYGLMCLILFLILRFRQDRLNLLNDRGSIETSLNDMFKYIIWIVFS